MLVQRKRFQLLGLNVFYRSIDRETRIITETRDNTVNQREIRHWIDVRGGPLIPQFYTLKIKALARLKTCPSALIVCLNDCFHWAISLPEENRQSNSNSLERGIVVNTNSGLVMQSGNCLCKLLSGLFSVL